MRTLVAALDAGARPGLLATVASENAVADGDGVLDGELMQACRGFPGHNLVMGGLAANDAAKSDTAAMTACPANESGGMSETQGKGDLEISS